jgi:hypothetical protein
MLNFDLSKFLKNAKATTTVTSSNAVIAPKELYEIGKRRFQTTHDQSLEFTIRLSY